MATTKKIGTKPHRTKKRNKASNDNEPKVLLTLDDGGVIAAKRYSFRDDEYAGIMAQCDDGSGESFTVTANPTHMEFYGIKVSNAASYAAKKKAVKAATGWKFDEEFPWLKTDNKGYAIPGTDTLETITDWLNAPIDGELIFQWGTETSTQYAPGIALMSSLTAAEKRALRMRESYSGGPASSLPCVATKASIEQLNRMLSKKALPYVFIDADGSEEGGWEEDESEED